ncbi:cobaltochelatase subunit CobN [Holophaga foetida]|uniref:cobaltochelatase subunit CobN n=1 Tax=Holophaga foetida TaxID=35839 RepID=UPI00024750BD|nr:cobaltochelatase subunit CobN [Holophaga foetida]
MIETRISYFSATATELTTLSQAILRLKAEDSDIRLWARTQAQLYDQARVDAFVREALASEAVIIALHGGKASCPAWEALFGKIQELKATGEKVPWIHIQAQGGDADGILVAQEHSDGLEDGTWAGLHTLLHRGGAVNTHRGLATLAARLKGANTPFPEPVPVPYEGIHHPDLGFFPDLDTYRSQNLLGGKPTVGVLFYQTYWLNQNLAPVEALIHALEARGADVIPVFSNRMRDVSLGNLGSDEVVEKYFKKSGKACIDVLVSAMGMSMTLTEKAFEQVLPGLDVPVLQAMTCSLPRKAWEESYQGMSSMDVTFQAAQPEFDGNLITLPIATREQDTVDPVTGALLGRLVPIEERVERMADLAIKWGMLRQKANAEKKVAIIFHHYPPRNDRIGCAAGLDTFESMRLLMERMDAAGYRLDQSFENADAVAQAMLSRLTCDQRWLTPEQMADRAEAKADRATFMPWHEGLPEKVREKMAGDWGAMPGALFVHEDQLHFAGLLNGNVFLTIQPPRGDLEKAGEMLHDLILSPTHHYLAHYRWIRDVFQADAVIHVGCHGSLEWLPGKALGLSEGCYPDLALHDLPNIYPYIINNPGEGTQAKRRSACALVDHLTPPFRNADLYEETADVARVLAEYQEAARQDPGKLPILAGMVWEATVKADLHQDLGLDEETAMADLGGFLDKLHAKLSELEDTMISDGLHTLGEVPAPERLEEYLAQLTRLPNGDVPSLREEILVTMGTTLDEVIAHRGERIFQGRSGGQLIAEAHAKALELVRALSHTAYDPAAVEGLVEATFGGPRPGLQKVMAYLAESLVPRIRKVTLEMDSILGALSGRFVPPGPSGAPTRGQADILPSGRNFFSLDPRCLPSPAAWEVGKNLGDALLARYQKEEGKYPQNVGIIVWGTSNMRTKGDDIAEILYLMGIRPLWMANGQVSGLEIMPLSELKRPRIDVTPRISGFFRDAFPNLVDMLDRAARMVAALGEAPESNYIRAHVLADAESYRSEGLGEDDAWRLATFRVFGCPPGTYGAGVAELVESKNWKTKEDLGEAYIRYSAHAYGKGSYGEVRPQAFRKLLGRMDATVKNEDSREWDMLSCTDFYNYHGGLIVAATTVRGVKPLAMVGDTSDPKHIVTRSTEEETKHILRARILNPKWIEGLQRHGYKGAGDISKVLDILIGWDATADVMEDWMYERVAGRYALDPEMQKWLKEVNPYALQNILDKLLETIQRGMWNATDEMKQDLEDAYMDIEGELEDALEGEPT